MDGRLSLTGSLRDCSLLPLAKFLCDVSVFIFVPIHCLHRPGKMLRELIFVVAFVLSVRGDELYDALVIGGGPAGNSASDPLD